MPYADVGDIRMYYEEFGSGAPLVLLHGGFSSLDDLWGSWLALTPFFAQQYHVVALEHRGHGRTNNPSGALSYERMADDVAEFVAQRNLAPAYVAGMSDGGIVGLHLAMAQPGLLRAVVGVGVNYVNDARVDEANAGFTLETIECEHPDWTEDFARRHDRNKEPGWWKVLLRQEQAMIAGSPAYTEEDLGRVQAPMLFIAGEDDPYGNPEQMTAFKRQVPGAEIMIVNHAGHIVQATHPQIVGPAIIEFLDRTAEAQRSG
jgi:pimeloyl-ACP methyl ester carboxylesterase